MIRTSIRITFAISCFFLTTCFADQRAINIWPGVAPGSENWTQKEKVIEISPIGAVILNVVNPTLTPYLPQSGKATGTGIIVAPGGAFVALAMDVEGNDVAHWVQEKGIAAFVLKYRIMEKKQEGLPTDMNVD